MATLVLPIRSDIQAYKFSMDLEGELYVLDFGFNTRSGRWYMSIYDSTGETLLVGDIPILINIPLHDQYIDERLPPGRFIALNEADGLTEAAIDTFGIDVKLFYQESA